jgi:hypothetical protein
MERGEDNARDGATRGCKPGTALRRSQRVRERGPSGSGLMPQGKVGYPDWRLESRAIGNLHPPQTSTDPPLRSRRPRGCEVSVHRPCPPRSHPFARVAPRGSPWCEPFSGRERF